MGAKPSGQTVLVVEDDFDLAEMYQLQLEAAGYEVYHAATAQGAINQLEKHDVDLIVLDILLPAQNGLSVVHELRSYDDWSKLPVVVLSNVSAQDLGINKHLLDQLGIFAYLDKTKTKPAGLQAAVKSALAGSRALS